MEKNLADICIEKS